MTAFPRRPYLSVAILSAVLSGAANDAYGDVVLSLDVTNNMSCSDNICAPTASDAVLNVTDLENMLAGGDVEVTTTGVGVQAGNVEIDAPLSHSDSSKLTLDAYGSIRVESSVTVAGDGGLSIVTNDGGENGQFSFGPRGDVTFLGTANTLSINGAAYTLLATLPDLAASIKDNPSGNYALTQDYDASQRGNYHSSPIPVTFEGNFNGLGNTISNLHIVGKTRRHKNRGLFIELDTSSSVSSLRLAHVKLEAEPQLNVGGIAVSNYGVIYNSSVVGTITSTRGQNTIVGGVTSINFGILDDVMTNVNVSLSSKTSGAVFVGDLSGGNLGTVLNSFGQGAISVVSASADEQITVGGLVGINEGLVEDCYATGSATEFNAGHAYVGGLIGINTLNLDASYSTGAPAAAEGASSFVGGLIGFDESADNGGTITDTYWDTTTSGVTNLGQGAGNIANDPGITGKTTEQLQVKLPKGFDHGIWAERNKINAGLPYLLDNEPR